MTDPVAVFESASEQAGYTMFPNVVLLDGSLTPDAKVVYALLRMMAHEGVGADLAPPREQIAERLGLGEKRVRAAVRELTEADPPLVRSKRRGQGKTNVYVLLSLESRTAETAGQERPNPPIPARGRAIAALSPGSKEGQREEQTRARKEPPHVVLTDGRNLPLDALLAAVGVDHSSPRVPAAVVALNGRFDQRTGKLKQPGIRHLFWLECVRWADEHEQLDRLDLAYAEPQEWSIALARRITEKAEKYMQVYDGAAISANALREHWLDLELAPRRRGGLSPGEIERMA